MIVSYRVGVVPIIIIVVKILDAGHHPLYPERGSRAVALLYSQTEQADFPRLCLTVIRNLTDIPFLTLPVPYVRGRCKAHQR